MPRPALETLLARERERSRRLDLHRRHAILAARLLAARQAQATALIVRARSVVDRWERERLCSRHYVSRWRAMLEGPGGATWPEAMLDPGDWTDALFQNTPWGFALEPVTPEARGPDPPGLQAEVLSIAILDGRFARTSFLDSLEASRARKALEEDRRWLRAKRARKR